MDEVVHQLILWEPKHGNKSVGGQQRTYVDQLESDIGINREKSGKCNGGQRGVEKKSLG